MTLLFVCVTFASGPERGGDDHARHLGQCDRKHGDFPLITTRCITACSPPTAVQRQQRTQDFVVGDVCGSRDGQQRARVAGGQRHNAVTRAAQHHEKRDS